MKILKSALLVIVPIVSLGQPKPSKPRPTQHAEVSVSGSFNTVGVDQRSYDQRRYTIHNHPEIAKKELAQLTEMLEELNARFGMSDAELSTALDKFSRLMEADTDDRNGPLLQELANKYRRSGSPKPILLGELFYQLAQNDFYHNRPARAFLHIDEAIGNDKLNFYYPMYKVNILNHVGRFEEEIELLLNTLPLCPSDTQRYNCYRMLAWCYGKVSNFEAAQQYAGHALRILEKQRSDVHLDISDTYNLKSVLYKNQGLFDKSIEAARAAFSYLRSTDTLTVIMQHNNVADLFIYFRVNADSAESHLSKGLQMAAKFPNLDWSTINLTMAELYHSKGSETQAAYYYDKAIEQTSKATADPKLRAVNIGEVCILIARNYIGASTLPSLNKAIDYSKQGLESIDDFPDLLSTGTASNLNNTLADAYFIILDFKRAKEYYSKCVGDFQQASIKNNFSGEVTLKLAICMLLSSEKESGIGLIRTEVFGKLKLTKDKALALNGFGMNCLDGGKCDYALTLFEAGAEILKMDPDFEKHYLYYLLCNNQAGAHFAKGNRQRAKYFYDLCHQGRSYISPAEAEELSRMESNVLSGKVKTACQ